MSQPHEPHRYRGPIAAFVASALALGGAAVLLGAQAGNASSHREAPQIVSDPQVDNTDVYAFVSPDKQRTVTLIGDWIPLEEPAGGPTFYPFADDARYYFNIDNDGDAKADVVYRWKFHSRYLNKKTFLYNTGAVTSLDDPDLNYRQTYTLTRFNAAGKGTVVARHVPVAPSDVGAASMPAYEDLSDEAIHPYNGKRRTFAGQADDPFFLDLRVFDLLYGADLTETGNDTLSGYNVNTIALQVPKHDLTAGDGDPVIGVWSSTDRPSMRMQSADGSQDYSGKYVQVSRLGSPLVNEVIVPVGLKDAFNALEPENDADVQDVVDRVNYPQVPRLIENIYGIPRPATPRDDLYSVFLTGLEGLNKPAGRVRPAEMLRLNTRIQPAANPQRLGVLAGDNSGFPNGRRLTDDVVDIELQALEGAVRTGVINPLLDDNVDANDLPFRDTFPYVALPHSGSDVAAGTGTRAGSAPRAGHSGFRPSIGQAPAGRSPATSTATAAIETQGGDGAPWAPIAAIVGLGFGGLGIVLLRRSRRPVRASS